ncbi:MAG: MMPL family transporter [Lentisphaeraceae bacterium]|nr:MMPL family transporter [Lentisphaeraceae bacterium]
MNSDRHPAKSFFAVITLTAIPLFLLIFSGLKINSNILELLPESGHSEKTERALKHFTENISSSSLFLLKSDSQEKLFPSAENFEKSLHESKLFKNVFGKKDDSEFKQWYELYFPHRFHFLTPENRKLLEEGKVSEFLTNRTKKLYSPQSSLYSSNLEKDPLMLFGDFIQELPSPGSFTVKNGFLYKKQNDSHLVFISANFKDSVFDSKTQKNFRGLLDTFNKNNPEVEVLQLGFFPYAERARTQAEWEISFIGSGSVIGIILLFILVFRSLNQLILTLLCISSGILWALILTQFLYGGIHIITIVFGATLCGVCADYAFHWFSHFKYSKESGEKNLQSAICWGAGTSLIAYAGLYFSNFPGLKQIAVFSSIGIIISVLTVLLLFPKFSRSAAKPPKIFQFCKRRFGSNKSYILLSVVLLISAVGFSSLYSNNDIRLLQNRPDDLVAQEEAFKSVLDPFDNSRFILVSAEKDDELLEKESSILKNINSEYEVIGGSLSISSMLPSAQQQKADYDLIKKVVNSQEFANYCNELGFEENVATDAVKNASDSKPLTLEEFLNHPAANQVKQLYINSGGKPSSIILLKDIKDDKELRMSLNQKGVYIDKVQDTSMVLSEIRSESIYLTFRAYFIIFFLLILKLGHQKTIRIMLPPLLAVFITCGLLGLTGTPYNLFNIISLILVLGIGIDYSIFYSFSGEDDSAANTAVSLSTISTLLAFGLLAFSSTPALSSFGLTLLLGILYSYALAPLGKT